MSYLNKYLFKRAVISIGGLILFAIVVLLLERLLRIFEIVSNSISPAIDATFMVINLLPHYLGIALPMALLIGTIITMDRFSRSSEIIAALGAGISLLYMTRPFLIIAFLLAIMTLFIEGYMQPLGRYNYREIVHMVKQQSFTAALREGNFTSVGQTTFFAGSEKAGTAIGPIFIYENLGSTNGMQNIRLTTADEGKLIVRDKTHIPVLQLAKGQTYQVINNNQLSGDLSFKSSAVVGTATEEQFRARGEDERELTSIELYQNRTGKIFKNLPISVNNSALHLRLARTCLLLLLPFIAVPFGINYGRNPSSVGIFIGIILLLMIQKSLEFAQSLSAGGLIAPWLGIWSVIMIVAIFACYLFIKTAYNLRQPPLTTLTYIGKNIFSKITGLTDMFKHQKKFDA